MSDSVIRLARASEYTAIGALTRTAYEADGFLGHDGQNSYGLTLADAATRAREAELLVAVDAEDTLLGTVTIAPPGSPWTELGIPDTLEFRMLAVSAAARGRGVGEALTRRVIDRATELGLGAVVLSSSEHMKTAHRLYERLGFQRTPASDWRPVPNLLLIAYRLDLPT